jgi:hypothetical protein
VRRAAFPLAVAIAAAAVMGATIGSVAVGASGTGRAPDKTTSAPTSEVAATTIVAGTIAPLPSLSVVTPTTNVAPSLAPATYGPSTTATTTAPSLAVTTAASTGPTVTNTPDEVAAALALFERVLQALTSDPHGLAELTATRTVPGSPANWFLAYTTGIATSLQTNDDQTAAQFAATATAADDGAGVVVCQAGSSLPCDEFAGFVWVDERLSSFSINGIDITGRFGTATPVTDGPLQVAGVIAFQRTSASSLSIVMSLTAGAQPVDIAWADATYVNPDGTNIPLTSGAGSVPAHLDAGAAGAAYVQFPDGLIGGVLDVPVTTADGATSTVSVAVVAIA